MLAPGRHKRALDPAIGAGRVLLRQLRDAADQLEPANSYNIGHGGRTGYALAVEDGAVLGPRASGQQRSTTMLSGQPQPQLVSRNRP